jgi:predicted acetyltransferase
MQETYPGFISELVTLGANYSQDEQGRWQPDYLPFWLDGNQPIQVWIFEVAQQRCGFCFIGEGTFPYKSENADFKICELYFLPEFRGKGLGKAAFEQIISGQRGTWELEVLHGNKPALAFWQSVLRDRLDLQITEREIDVLFQFHNP